MIILLDVEGTTTSIDFVHKTLFPYSAERLPGFLRDHAERADVSEALAALGTRDLGEATALLQQWIREDVKNPILKNLQGLIWKEGYESGAIRGHVYADVPQAFEKWTRDGHRLGIYSSGSVLAQRLIFGFSSAGDLNRYLSFNFDTAVGAKRERASYETIARELKAPPEEILFLSDVPQELEAARAAGFLTTQIVREGTAASRDFPTAPDLLSVDVSGQRGILKKFFLNTWNVNSVDLDLVERVKALRPQRVLDVGCGANLYKPLIPDLTGFDIVNPKADFVCDILDFKTTMRYDVILVLGSINFGGEEDVLSRWKKVRGWLSPGGRIFVRVNPGISWDEAPELIMFPWTKDNIVSIGAQAGLKLAEPIVERQTKRGLRYVFSYQEI